MDVTLALDNGYPQEQRHKLLLRRADCHIELGSAESARAALVAASEHAMQLQLVPAHAGKFIILIYIFLFNLVLSKKLGITLPL